jgi:hypothetical protein
MSRLPAERPPGRPARRDQRVSDADRERCMQILRHHYAEGRLGDAELEQRLENATLARTWGELRSLTRDLPRSSAPGRLERANRVAVRAHATGWAAANGSSIGAWGLAGADGFFWPAWIIGPTTALLASHLLATRRLRARRPTRR